ncbi:MAG: 16S rRNA (uracil(1498)-N(3))-methyltransferase [Bacteroidales bacterium]|nr:16S rRNA (uracil(1498)-N(3))-methyltransferase [Bacteroidales bacterium]
MHFACLPEAKIGIMTLPEEESKHCVRVLRMEVGTAFKITNGSGKIFDAVMQEAHPKKAVVALSNPEKGYDFWSFKLCIAIAPTKNNDRLEWFLEKATEIGIDEIFLFHSFHSERRQVKPERLQKVLVAALKQSLKSRLPKIHDLQSFNQFVKQDFQGRKFIAWIDGGVTDLLANTYKKGENCLVLIGPEGDFSPEEVALAQINGFETVSLGQARLRTETAALVACHSLQLINQMK